MGYLSTIKTPVSLRPKKERPGEREIDLDGATKRPAKSEIKLPLDTVVAPDHHLPRCIDVPVFLVFSLTVLKCRMVKGSFQFFIAIPYSRNYRNFNHRLCENSAL